MFCEEEIYEAAFDYVTYGDILRILLERKGESPKTAERYLKDFVFESEDKYNAMNIEEKEDAFNELLDRYEDFGSVSPNDYTCLADKIRAATDALVTLVLGETDVIGRDHQEVQKEYCEIYGKAEYYATKQNVGGICLTLDDRLSDLTGIVPE